MNLQEIVNRARQKLQAAQEKIALRLLIWFEKEPSQDRVLTTPGTPDSGGGPYVRYKSRAKRRAAEEEKILHDRTRPAA